MAAFDWQEREGVGFWRVDACERATPCLAAFSSRLGGLSQGPYESLNLGGRGDDPASVAENRRRFASAAGCDVADLAAARQVHGDGVAEVEVAGPAGEADALVTRRIGPVLTVLVADCVPLFLVDPVRRVVALAHAGWRGSAAGIAVRTLERLLAGGGDPARVVAAIGPSAGPCCYEVDEPVLSRFPPEVARPGRPGHAQLDLWGENRRQLIAAGVAPRNIHVAGVCTICQPRLLFSHRRGRGAPVGQMAAFLGLR